jgi:polyribonucleotide nucleotidyltransferase
MEGERTIRHYEMDLAGRPLKVEIGKVANLANGSAMVSYGDTCVLCTVCGSKKPKDGIDFFPLTVEYEEKMYSVGKIPGGYIKREGRPSEKAVLTSRLIDRPIRPLFPEGYRNEVQVVATVFSVDQENQPDIVAMIGSSIVLSISDIPFEGPTGSVTVGYIDGEYIINPTTEQREKTQLTLVVSGTKDAVMMVEAGANILSEEVMLGAIMRGHDEIKKIVAFVESIAAEIGKVKMPVVPYEINEAQVADLTAFLTDKLHAAVRIQEKAARNEVLDEIKDAMMTEFSEKYPDTKGFMAAFFKEIEKDLVRKMITFEAVRPDGRKIDEIRPISCEVGLLPRTHGSGLFTRGLTQALTITTLGALGEAQRLDGISEEETKRYMHHYNFPPFSVGETGMSRTNRRAIGHGALGERALVPVLPSEDDFPYAIRLVSEVLTCNGSSSQASICGSTLSLLDAGVPLKDLVAGIAMGLIKEENSIAILSDIQGMEDALGDMDFKVAGTKDGITALQMDIKVKGISREILERALEQARVGRLHILEKMKACIDVPRAEMSVYAPRVFKISINPDKIRDVIGPGGKVITRICADHNVKIDIEDTGRVLITANDGIGGENALKEIQGIVKEIQVGEIYNAKVVRIMTFGAFVELLPGKEALCHISQLTKERLKTVEEAFKIGDELMVKVIEIDAQKRVNVSRKVLLGEENK